MLFTQDLAWLYPEAARELLCARPLERRHEGRWVARGVTQHELTASPAVPASALPLVLLTPGCCPSRLSAWLGHCSMSPSWSPSCSLPSRVLSYCAVHHNSLLLGSSFFLPWLKKIPLKTTLFSRVCVFLPFQPFLPSLQFFSPWCSHPMAQFSKARLLSRLKVSLAHPQAKHPITAGYSQF